MAAVISMTPPYPKTPVVAMDKALICLVINILVPGIGTIVAGVLGNKPQIGKGIAQLVLTIIVVGWIWGIVTGIQLLQNAKWMETKGTMQPSAVA
ncbi:MAG TPA: hypothetical protein VI997_11385 [Candidatus Thermoplasmatota archaeon]|nr:hypothetical protein [Candidatus Thermoplasmatota archaeon]